jgi:hypothetical protein
VFKVFKVQLEILAFKAQLVPKEWQVYKEQLEYKVL